MINLIIAITVGLVIAAGGAFATQSLLSTTPGGANIYQYGAR